MRKQLNIICTLFIMTSLLLTGCTTGKESEASAKVYSNDVNSNISLSEKESFFSPRIIQNLEEYLHEGVTVREGLEKSGIVSFNEDGNVRTINQVSLDPSFEWSFEINGKKLGKDNLDTVLKEHDEISINIQSAEHKKDNKSPQFVVLKLNGGIIKPDLTHSYVFPFIDKENVRDLLKYSNFVNLTANNMSVDSVQGYSPKSIEKWVVKVNGKVLVENGLEMKLTPQDEVEIWLERST